MGDNDSLYKDSVKSAGCQCHCEGRVRCKWFSAGPVAMVRSSDEAKVNDWRTVMTMIKMNWIWTSIPRAPLATTPSNGDRLPQESLQLLKVHCLPLGVSWGGLLKLKVNLMKLIITDNYALNSTTLGLIIYWVRNDKWKKKDDGSWQAGYTQKGILIKGGLLFPPSFEEEVDVLKQPAFLSVSPSPLPLSFSSFFYPQKVF